MLHLALGLYASLLQISDALLRLSSMLQANTASFADSPRAGERPRSGTSRSMQEFLLDVHNSYGLSKPTGEKRNPSLSKSFLYLYVISYFVLAYTLLTKTKYSI